MSRVGDRAVADLLVAPNLASETMMALSSLQLSWQWPAGRAPDHKLLLDVRNVRRQRIRLSRLFSNVESAADYLPDAMEVTGTVALGREYLLGANAALCVPRM